MWFIWFCKYVNYWLLEKDILDIGLSLRYYSFRVINILLEFVEVVIFLDDGWNCLDGLFWIGCGIVGSVYFMMVKGRVNDLSYNKKEK